MILTSTLLTTIVEPTTVSSLLWWAVTGLLTIVATLAGLFYKNITESRKEIKEELVKERETNSELSERLEANNVDNIKTLNEFSNFLQALITSNDRMKSDISRDILDSVKDIKTHIDERLRSIKYIKTDE
jgi:predicted nuclease with TOPRIM domain